MKPLLVVGGGGHCHACIDVVEAQGIFAIQGIVERSGQGHTPVLGYPVVGNDADLGSLLALTPAALIAVGQIGSSSARLTIYELLVKLGAQLPVIVSPLSHVSAHASIGQGTIIMHGAIVNALATIGRNCIINSQALIEHDVIIRDHCHISTGARVNGGTKIGAGTFIGSGAVLRDGICVGSNCVIGAGVVVLEDMPDGMKYVGSSPREPFRKIRID
jgi:sugar O-acyltransferase (sialic acid O-acetyltransferase NeuD family)